MEPSKKNIDRAKKLFTQKESIESQLKSFDRITLEGKYEMQCVSTSGSFVLPNSGDFDYVKVLIANKVKEYYQDQIDSINQQIKEL